MAFLSYLKISLLFLAVILKLTSVGMSLKRRFLRISLLGNDSNLLIVFYVQIMPDDLVMQLHRF
ncbi:hypothetical protein CSW66_26290 [Shigella boydii]|nr:hypothetical protein CSW66_26290 [Shigella boydii]